MDLSKLPQHWCSHRFTTTTRVDLIVVHTNEGPEGANSAEGLAAYIAQPNVVPGYHFTVDENSVVQTCPLTQRCNGAGGVNSRAIHVCITGYAAQSDAEWHDPSSTAAVALATDLVATLCAQLGVPHVRVTDSRTGRGVCGHVDVSRYYAASMGHSDPGEHFPWATLLGAAPAPTPDPPGARLDDMKYVVYGDKDKAASPGGYARYLSDFGTKRWVRSIPERDMLFGVQDLIEVKMEVGYSQDYIDAIPLVGPKPPGYNGAVA